MWPTLSVAIGDVHNTFLMSHVHIILETNCYLSRPSWWDRVRLSLRLTAAVPCEGNASVWLSTRPLGPDEGYTAAARKLLGPVPSP